MSEVKFSEFCPGCGNLLDFPLSSQEVKCNLCAYSQPCKGKKEAAFSCLQTEMLKGICPPFC